jgi:hypothetical protein
MLWRLHPQDSARSLAPHPHRFTLRGEPAGWEFPPLCPNCGRSATERLVCEKVFRRLHSEAPNTYVTASVAVPFCDDCLAAHRAASGPGSRWGQWLASFASIEMLNAVYPAIGAAITLWMALSALFDGHIGRFLAMLLLTAGFAAFAWFQRRRVWLKTAYLRASPQGEVARAFDFSDDVAPAFEPSRHVCTVRDARFAAEFIALNRAREWVAGSASARRERQRADRKGWIVGAVVLALVVVSVIDEWLG